MTEQWAYGDMDDEFERRLDTLLARHCPGCSLPTTRPEDPELMASRRRYSKREQLRSVLQDQPSVAATFADQVLGIIVCDEDVSFNRHLIEPVLTTVGRRAVQEYLISTVVHGSIGKKVCAVRAWYHSQAALVYGSLQAARDGHPAASSKAEDEQVADLRATYRAACLTAFVECDCLAARECLAYGFILDESCYPPAFSEKVAAARAIAHTDPVRFKELLTRTDDGTSLATIRLGPT